MNKKRIDYLQVIGGRAVAEFTKEELAAEIMRSPTPIQGIKAARRPSRSRS